MIEENFKEIFQMRECGGNFEETLKNTFKISKTLIIDKPLWKIHVKLKNFPESKHLAKISFKIFEKKNVSNLIKVIFE